MQNCAERVPGGRLDFEQIAREFLVALRGTRSQVAWSRRLGYRSNVAYSWEAGRRWPTAAETLRACRRSGIDVEAAITTFYGEPPSWLGELDVATPEGVARLLDDMRGQTSVTALSARADIGRYSVARWLAGQTQPRLPYFFRLVEAASVRLVDLLTALVEPACLPSVLPLWEQIEARRTGAHEVPWTQAVIRAIELEAYRALPAHEPGWIARQLGIGLEEEARCLDFMRRAGQVAWTGTHYTQGSRVAVDTRRHPAIGRRLQAHWSHVARQRILAAAPGQFSYNVFSVSREDFERIRALHLQYFHALRGIVADSAPNEVVAVANVQLFALDEEGTLDVEG